VSDEALAVADRHSSVVMTPAIFCGSEVALTRRMLRVAALSMFLVMGAGMAGVTSCEPSSLGAGMLAMWAVTILVTIALVGRFIASRRIV